VFKYLFTWNPNQRYTSDLQCDEHHIQLTPYVASLII